MLCEFDALRREGECQEPRVLGRVERAGIFRAVIERDVPEGELQSLHAYVGECTERSGEFMGRGGDVDGSKSVMFRM